MDFLRCPSSQSEPWVHAFLRSLSAYRDGFLPVAGGMQDQAAAWIEALRCTMPYLRECEQIATEREAKNRRG